VGSKSKYRLTKKIWRYASNDVISGSRDQNRDISAWFTTHDLGWFRQLCLVSKISRFFAVKLFTRKYSLGSVLTLYFGRPATKRALSISSAGLPLIMFEKPCRPACHLLWSKIPEQPACHLLWSKIPEQPACHLLWSKIPGQPACHLLGSKIPGQPACHLLGSKIPERPACHLYGQKISGRPACH
jgi:hypothetical protein